jgi:hypothetical protein
MPRKRRRRAYGAGTVDQRGPGNFRIRWRDANGIRHTKAGFPDRETAMRVLTLKVQNVVLGREGVIDPSRQPFLKDLGQGWFDRRLKTHRSADADLRRWNRHLVPLVGHMRPAQLDAAFIRRIVESGASSNVSWERALRLLRVGCW